MKAKKINVDIRPVIREMKQFESELFPIEKSVNVRNTCSAISMATGMKFRTEQQKENKTIEVVRIS